VEDWIAGRRGHLVVVHVTYFTRPPFPGIPHDRIILPSGSEGELRGAVVFNTGDSIRVVSVVDSQSAMQYKV